LIKTPIGTTVATKPAKKIPIKVSGPISLGILMKANLMTEKRVWDKVLLGNLQKGIRRTMRANHFLHNLGF